METKTFFFDTYAFFEMIRGNENYKKYSTNIAIVTTKLNLMELYYGLLIKHGKDVAEKYYDSLLPFAVKLEDDAIKIAMEFKAKSRDKNFSYVDCIGYAISVAGGIKFLTGDRQFEKLPNVEFVK